MLSLHESSDWTATAMHTRNTRYRILFVTEAIPNNKKKMSMRNAKRKQPTSHDFFQNKRSRHERDVRKFKRKHEHNLEFSQNKRTRHSYNDAFDSIKRLHQQQLGMKQYVSREQCEQLIHNMVVQFKQMFESYIKHTYDDRSESYIL